MKQKLLTLMLTAMSVGMSAQNMPEEKLSMTFYALRNMYVDSVYVSPLVEQQMKILMQCLDPHSEYLTPEQARANEDMLLGPTARGNEELRMKNPSDSVECRVESLKFATAVPKGNGTAAANSKLYTLNSTLNGTAAAARPLDACYQRDARNSSFFTLHSSFNDTGGAGGGSMLDKSTGYIAIGVFVQSTIDEFHQAVDSLRRLGMKSLVLDIRNNPGGFFDSALGMADEFLPVGSLLVTTEGKHQPRQEVKAQVKGLWETGKVVVLINENTMSAAEIFAGAMQDWDRAVLVGSRTFGKGLIQETLPFSDGSAIRLSVARGT